MAGHAYDLIIVQLEERRQSALSKKDDTKKTRGAVTKDNPVWQAIRHASAALTCRNTILAQLYQLEAGLSCALSYACLRAGTSSMACSMLHDPPGKDKSVCRLHCFTATQELWYSMTTSCNMMHFGPEQTSLYMLIAHNTISCACNAERKPQLMLLRSQSSAASCMLPFCHTRHSSWLLPLSWPIV